MSCRRAVGTTTSASICTAARGCGCLPEPAWCSGIARSGASTGAPQVASVHGEAGRLAPALSAGGGAPWTALCVQRVPTWRRLADSCLRARRALQMARRQLRSPQRRRKRMLSRAAPAAGKRTRRQRRSLRAATPASTPSRRTGPRRARARRRRPPMSALRLRMQAPLAPRRRPALRSSSRPCAGPWRRRAPTQRRA